MTLWYCDACGVELTALRSISRTYGLTDYKTLCGGCSAQMDKAALDVYKSIRLRERPSRRGLLARIREALG
jgi:hypothetical protein